MNLGGEDSQPHYRFASSRVSDVAFELVSLSLLIRNERYGKTALAVVTGGPRMLSHRMFVCI